mgnify:CR=1 FL=1
MKRILIILFIVFSIQSCKSDDKCGEIINKVIVENNYKFILCFSNCSRNTGSNSNPSVPVEGEVPVTKNIYNEFEIGEDYCAE